MGREIAPHEGAPLVEVDILTLFPDAVEAMLHESIIGRAVKAGLLRIDAHQIREYTHNKQMQVDDYPYGGGMGMVMQADPLYNCWKDVCDKSGERVHTILMSPQGTVFTQKEAKRLKADYKHIIFVCGHYEGIDQRFIDECVDEEMSLGDFVMTGGEIAAVAMTDAICRMVPGVLASDECFTEESHWSGLLEYPQYSRPEVWHDREVPAILLSGHHANIAKWRRVQSLRKTQERRPDLYEKYELSKEEKKWLKWYDEQNFDTKKDPD